MTSNFLFRFGENDITLKPEQIEFGWDTVEVAKFKITSDCARLQQVI